MGECEGLIELAHPLCGTDGGRRQRSGSVREPSRPFERPAREPAVEEACREGVPGSRAVDRLDAQRLDPADAMDEATVGPQLEHDLRGAELVQPFSGTRGLRLAGNRLGLAEVRRYEIDVRKH